MKLLPITKSVAFCSANCVIRNGFVTPTQQSTLREWLAVRWKAVHDRSTCAGSQQPFKDKPTMWGNAEQRPLTKQAVVYVLRLTIKSFQLPINHA